MSQTVLQKLGRVILPVENPLQTTASDSSLLAYRDLLDGYYGFCAPLEGRLSGYGHWAPLKFARRRKTPLLAQDLFDLSHEGFELGMVPLCGNLPDVMQLPQALACIYVIEAIAMNGRSIATRLAGQIGLTGSQGINFFSCYGHDSVKLWEELVELIRLCSTEKTDGMMLEAASATMTKLAHWMGRPRAETLRQESYVGFPRLSRQSVIS